METDDLPLSRELVAGPSLSKSVNSITAPTSTGKKPPPAAFNASGSLGIVLVPAKPFASGSTISATQAVIDAESARPPVAPANIQVAVGSGLAPGATVTIVKKNLGKKGVRSEMGIRMMSKGKGKQVESESESEGSAFDSSDDGNDEKEEAEEAAEDSDGGSWKGIPDEDSVAVEVDSDQEEEDSSEDEEDESEPRRKKGAFQAWAESQVLVAAGYDAPPPVTSSWNDGVYVPLLPDGSGAGFQSVPDPTGITGPLGEILSGTQLPSLPPQRTTYVQIDRTEEMQKQREQLPIVKEEDRIMDAIRGNAVVVICGETGSGKTTQIGQFLWEAGWGDASSGMFSVRPFVTDSGHRQPGYGRYHAAATSRRAVHLATCARRALSPRRLDPCRSPHPILFHLGGRLQARLHDGRCAPARARRRLSAQQVLGRRGG